MDEHPVVIGMDPDKRSVTIESMMADERIVGHGRFGTDTDGFTQLLAYASGWPGRIWAVEGCEGIGRHVAQRLIAAGETVVDVPAKLSARMRVRHRSRPQDRRHRRPLDRPGRGADQRPATSHH